MRSRKLLCEAVLAEWFKCARLLRAAGRPAIQGCLEDGWGWPAGLPWLPGKLKEL